MGADRAALLARNVAGVERVVHWVPSAGRSRIEQELERWEAAVAEFNGE